MLSSGSNKLTCIYTGTIPANSEDRKITCVWNLKRMEAILQWMTLHIVFLVVKHIVTDTASVLLQCKHYLHYNIA